MDTSKNRTQTDRGRTIHQTRGHTAKAMPTEEVTKNRDRKYKLQREWKNNLAIYGSLQDVEIYLFKCTDKARFWPDPCTHSPGGSDDVFSTFDLTGLF